MSNLAEFTRTALNKVLTREESIYAFRICVY